jgi:cytoskeletal protein CcmA (bactofilin family)
LTSPFIRSALAPADPPGGGDAPGGPRAQRPLVPGIPSRRVDPNGVVTQQTRYQRPNQQQAAQHTVADAGELVVGQGITVKGGIRNCRRLVVHGKVQATVPAQALEVGPEGVVEGRIEVAEATIAGRFDGDLIVDGALTVAPGGLIKGRVRYRTLTVESGGHVSAEIDHIDNAALPAADAPAAAQQAPAETAEPAQAVGSGSENGHADPAPQTDQPARAPDAGAAPDAGTAAGDRDTGPGAAPGVPSAFNGLAGLTTPATTPADAPSETNASPATAARDETDSDRDVDDADQDAERFYRSLARTSARV